MEAKNYVRGFVWLQAGDTITLNGIKIVADKNGLYEIRVPGE